MCYELFKNGVLVYTDCAQALQNTTNHTNTTTYNVYNDTASSSLLLINNVSNFTTIYNISRNSTYTMTTNETVEVYEVNSTCCACSNISFNTTSTVVVHRNVSTHNSNFSTAPPANIDEGTWIAVLLCISLFCLCIVRNYARVLRSEHAKVLSLHSEKEKTLNDVVPEAQPAPAQQDFENPLQQSQQKKPYVKLVRKKKATTSSKKKKYLVASVKSLQDNSETKHTRVTYKKDITHKST